MSEVKDSLSDIKNTDLTVKTGGPAWEGDGNIIQRLVSTIIQMVARPMQTFEPEAPEMPERHSKPLMFAIYSVVPFVFVGLLLQALLDYLIVPSIARSSTRFLGVIIMPVLQIGFLYLGALLSHLGLRIFKVDREDFWATFRVAGYSRAVFPLYVIPYLGGMAAGAWSLVLTVLGCIVVHKGREEGTTGMIVLGVIMLPIAAMLVLGVLWFIALRIIF